MLPVADCRREACPNLNHFRCHSLPVRHHPHCSPSISSPLFPSVAVATRQLPPPLPIPPSAAQFLQALPPLPLPSSPATSLIFAARAVRPIFASPPKSSVRALLAVMAAPILSLPFRSARFPTARAQGEAHTFQICQTRTFTKPSQGSWSPARTQSAM